MKNSLTAMSLLAALSILPACRADEASRGYSGGDETWVLQEIDGKGFAARATLTFPETGRVAGQAPCNRYFGAMTAPYPEFDASKIAATRRACPDLEAEQTFIAALSEMTLSAISDDRLILSNDAGRNMMFKAE